MSPPRRDQPLDPSSVLGIPSRGVRVLLVAYAVTLITLAATAGAEPMRSWTGGLALALSLVGAVVAVGPDRYPLPLPRLGVLVPIPAVAGALVAVRMTAPGQPGYTAWYVLSGCLILLVVAIRGRIGAAWLGFAALTGVNILWALGTGRPVVDGIALDGHTTAILVAGSLFAFGLNRLLRRLDRVTRLERRQAAELEAARASIETRLARMAEFDTLVRDPLQQIAAGGPQEESQRASLRILENELRDRLRGRAFATEPALTAVREARRHGVDVAVLDDLAPVELDEPSEIRLSGMVVDVLADVTGRPHDGPKPACSVTFRLFRENDGTVLLSIAVESGATSSRTERPL